MKQDLDRYLEEAGLDGLLVIGPATHNPSMTYFTGLVNVGWGILARRRNAPPVLYCNDMEREEAARSGLQQSSLDWADLTAQAEGDLHGAAAIAFENVLRQNNLLGRIQIHGLDDTGDTIEAFRRLVQRLPGLEIVAPPSSQSPLERARATKGPDEVERIRRMGAITIEIVDRVADFLSSQRVRKGILVDRLGEAVTVGDVKRRIRLWLAERDAESPEGTIFAVGRDAGIPHNTGAEDQPIPIGVPIVFDLFPCEAGGGYFYDFTRTWCLGHAADQAAQLHQDVSQAYRLALAQARPGANARAIQVAVCEYFEERGHSSVLTSPNTRDGYVHSIGHGLGLEVHEPPFFRLPMQPPASLEAGHVLTIEPGLYYPERGLGVRLEDTFCIGRDGPQVLAAYPMDLILPMRRSPRGQASKASRTKKTPARSGTQAKRGG